MDTNIQNLLHSIKFVLFDKMKTSNPIIDAIMTTVVLGFFAKLVQYYDTIKYKDICELAMHYMRLYKPPNKIVISGKNSTLPNVYGEINSTSLYSDRFVALLDYIIQNMNRGSINEIRELYSSTINNNMSKTGEYLMVSQKEPFLLDDDICFQVSSKKEEYEQKKVGITSEIEVITIEVSSITKSIQYLTEFVDRITHDYRKTIHEDRKTKQFIYTAIKTTVSEDEPKYSKWEEQVFHSNRHFDNLFLENKAQILSRVDFFLENKDWYDKRGIPYNLGIGLHGPPGTGKTSFIKALANKTKRDLVVIPLSIVHTRMELYQLFYETTYNIKNEVNSKTFDKKIIVFEDIDCVGDIVKNREHQKKMVVSPKPLEGLNGLKGPVVTDPLKLDDFLNLWDGIMETPGRIMILTSNFYKDLDPALIRPGRIDMSCEFKMVNHAILEEIHEKFYEKKIDGLVLEKIKEYFYSPAEILNHYMAHVNDEQEYLMRLQRNEKFM